MWFRCYFAERGSVTQKFYNRLPISITDLPDTFQVESVQVNVEYKYDINKYGTIINDTASAEELSEIFTSVSDELQKKSTLFLYKVFFLLYFSGITVYIFLIHTAEIVQDFKLHQGLRFCSVFLVMSI